MYPIGTSTCSAPVTEAMLTYGDFAHNARTLYAGERPSAMGTPIPGLGMWA